MHLFSDATGTLRTACSPGGFGIGWDDAIGGSYPAVSFAQLGTPSLLKNMQGFSTHNNKALLCWYNVQFHKWMALMLHFSH